MCLFSRPPSSRSLSNAEQPETSQVNVLCKPTPPDKRGGRDVRGRRVTGGPPRRSPRKPKDERRRLDRRIQAEVESNHWREQVVAPNGCGPDVSARTRSLCGPPYGHC